MRRPFEQMAEWTGLEPATPGVTGRYSNRLNYHSALEPLGIIFRKCQIVYRDNPNCLAGGGGC
jgi:hypothetical protein